MSTHYPAELLIAANENDSGPSSTQALNGLIALLARAEVRAIAARGAANSNSLTNQKGVLK